MTIVKYLYRGSGATAPVLHTLAAVDMSARFVHEAPRNSVDVRIKNVQVVKTPVAFRVVHGVCALALVTMLFTYTGITSGTNYSHYTSWSFTLASTYVLSDFFTRKYTSVYLAPLAFAVTQSVASLTVAMYIEDAGIIKDSLHEHSYAIVSTMNVVLHVIPALIVATLVATSRHELSVPKNYIVICIFMSLAFSATYFMTFSPNHQYKVAVSNTTIRLAVVTLHSFFSLFACAIIDNFLEK